MPRCLKCNKVIHYGRPGTLCVGCRPRPKCVDCGTTVSRHGTRRCAKCAGTARMTGVCATRGCTRASPGKRYCPSCHAQRYQLLGPPGICSACRKPKSKGRRGLCYSCRYPLTSRRAADLSLLVPTDALPGSQEKMDVMAERARLGLPLHHPKDTWLDCRDLDIPLAALARSAGRRA